MDWEDRVDEPRAIDLQARALAAWRRLLLAETGFVAAAVTALLWLAPATEGAMKDARFVYGVVLALVALPLVRVIGSWLCLLEIECPRCSEPFYGDQVVPVPWRGRCADCGFKPASV